MKVNFDKIKDSIINFIVPILALVATALLVLLWIYPSISRLPLLNQEVDAKRRLSSQLDTKLQNLNRLLDFKSVVDENSRIINNVLVSEPNVPILLTQIDTIARESGLAVDKLSYSFSEFNKTGTTTGDYNKITVSLGVNGSYSQLATFMENIENSARLVDIVSFRYSVSNSDEVSSLQTSMVLESPYIEVESEAVTDEPIDIDVTDDEFISLIDQIKSLKFYDIRVASQVVEEAVEEEEIEDIEVAEASEESVELPTEETTDTEDEADASEAEENTAETE